MKHLAFFVPAAGPPLKGTLRAVAALSTGPAGIYLVSALPLWYSKNMKLMFVKKFLPALAGMMALFAAACAGGPEIPEGLSPAEMIQRAQEASDKNRYRTAARYYEAILERYATNLDLVCMAEYEIAFIYYKQNKYSLAKEGFTALLERYNNPDEELMPQQFKKLARIVLESIEEKEKAIPLFLKDPD
jgi:tetratricopeptide (TPR) repeat protein